MKHEFKGEGTQELDWSCRENNAVSAWWEEIKVDGEREKNLKWMILKYWASQGE